ncbi:tyrosine-type recombinase/integrase [Dietzia alimentaria]|uniref:tyrosine-type recombinase/integrase n=1 Tax=Dietzia alimentaria TaxID=665550 RepID=UPI001303DA40|nr:tyrosine-type recombinase/integrase [Dietzia alimentaria]
MRAFIIACAPHASLAYLDNNAREEVVTAQLNENYVSFSRDVLRIIANEHIAAMGLDPLEVEVIDTTQLGLVFIDVGEKVRRNSAHQLDLRPISQPWIRTVYREWLREKIEAQEPVRSRDLSQMLFAARVGSESLSKRKDNGDQLSFLGLADMRDAVRTFAELKKDNGELYSHQARRQRLTRFKQLIEFGRSRGYLSALHNGFADGPGLSIPIDEAIEEEKGRYIPETVIRKLDDNLSDFNSSARPGADVCPEVYSELLRTVYQLLRDTGRRPAEIYGLRYDCLRLEGETSVLIWDNKKGRRYNRRLPILPSTATIIVSWKKYRKEKEPDWWTDDFLFPPLYKNVTFFHLQSNNFTPCFNEWTSSIELTDADLRDVNGVAINFSRQNLRPYGFRHSYAQRLVDAGVPIETVRELMDHKSISTTQVYFKVRDDSKRRAMETAARYTVDRFGSQVKSSSSGYVLETVAVPYGRCVNPSNVKAGGHSCPVRFRCTGCPDFRSDPLLTTTEDCVAGEARRPS